MLHRIELQNYKRFRKYSIKLSTGNLLVGPNNAGKSSLLDALRILEICLRFARRRKPIEIAIDDGSVFPGYKVTEGFTNFNFANTIFNYGDSDAIIKFTLTNNNEAFIRIHPDRTVRFYLDAPLQKYLHLQRFNQMFDLNIVVIPTISMLEVDANCIV